MIGLYHVHSIEHMDGGMKHVVLERGDDEMREVARFYDRGEADEYANWRNDLPAGD